MEILPAFQADRPLPFILYLCLLGKLTIASAVVPFGLFSRRAMQMWLNSFGLDPCRPQIQEVASFTPVP